jgi:enoyl-CoA hydratase
MSSLTEPPITFEWDDGMGFITLRNPPVNALGLEVRRALQLALRRAASDYDVRAVILMGAGNGFSAGGDKRELLTGGAVTRPRLTLDIHPMIEQMNKPVVAAAHGYAVGGGLETMLACHFRVACADTRIGLPEIAAGIVPLSGTQRLPRVVSMTDAIDMLLSSRKRPASDFAHSGLFDRVVEAGHIGALREAAIDVAKCALLDGLPYPLIRWRPLVDAGVGLSLIADARAHLPQTRDRHLREAALDALTATVEANSFDEGMAIATRICERVLASKQLPR